jgi:hypothetical protein
MTKQPFVTVILHPNGDLRVASDKITVADARRWAASGSHVFCVAAVGGRWAMQYVNADRIVRDGDADYARVTEESDVLRRLTFKPEPLRDEPDFVHTQRFEPDKKPKEE